MYHRHISELLRLPTDGSPSGVVVHQDESCQDIKRHTTAKVVLSGSFNPLHRGHLSLLGVAAEMTELEPFFEISCFNADGKRPLSGDELIRVVQQNLKYHPCIVTNTALFADKAPLVKQAVFVMGMDTLERFFDARFYPGQSGISDAVNTLKQNGCSLLVAGRLDKTGNFQTLSDIELAKEYRSLVSVIPEARFRADISSTEIRRNRDRRSNSAG